MRARPLPTRRAVLTTLGAVTLVGATAACDLPGPGSSQETEGGDADQRPDPDRRRVETARLQAEELLSLVVATGGTHSELAPRLAPLADCHRAHLQALGGDEPVASPRVTPAPDAPAPPAPTAPGTAPSASPEVALRRLVAREQAHASALGTEAGVAESGALARLLASMAAGVLGHLDSLEPLSATGGTQ